MNRIIFLIIFIVVLSNTGRSQNYNWMEQTSGTTDFLGEMYFINNFEGFIGTISGLVLRTTNGGAVWGGMLNYPSANVIVGMHFQDAENGWVTNNWGQVWHTTDAGDSPWVNQYSGTSYANSMIENDGRLLVGYNNQIVYSDNGGSSWDSTSCQVFGSIIDITFGSSDVGYALGVDNYVSKTTNNGDDWSTGNVISTAPFSINDLYAINENLIFAVGDTGTIMKSTNGGGLWVPITISPTFDNFYEIDFANASHGIIAGSNGAIYETVDGGNNWLPNTAPNSLTLYAAQCMTNTLAYTCGAGGKINRSPAGVEDINMLTYLGPDTICVGEPFDFSFQFSNIGGGPSFNPGFTVEELGQGYLYGDTIYYNGSLDSGDVEIHTQPGTILTNPGTTNVEIIAVEQNNQSNNTLVATIEVVTPNSTDITGGTFFCPGDTITLEASGGNDYFWQAGISNDINNPVQVVNPIQTTSYIVEIVQDYCKLFDTVWVFLDPNCTDHDTINPAPSNSYAFSPNFDGVNDYLVLDFIDPNFDNNSVTIYNRWGDIVFETRNYNNDDNYWDGTYGKRNSPPGTYFLIARTSNSGSVKAWVQIVK